MKSFYTELESFQAYRRIYPRNCILLVDSYDTSRSGVPNAIKVRKELRERKQGTEIDIRDVETRLVTSYSCPALGGVYKLSAIFEEESVPDGQKGKTLHLLGLWDPVLLDWGDFKNSGTGVGLLQPDQDSISRLVFPTRGGDHIRV